MGRVSGKVAMVTGGASGIGRASCTTLVAEGAEVIVADVNEEGGLRTVESIGSAAVFQSLDVTREDEWIQTMRCAINNFGRLDFLVNCAGIGVSGDFEDTSLDEWNDIMAVNLTGVFLGCKHAIKVMKTTGHSGSIINISSIAGLVGGEDIAAYSASKGGVTLLTKSAALSCASRGLNIRCNSVHPTYVDTEMLDPIAELFPDRDAMRAGMIQSVPIGRLAVAQDIANVVLFLASDESAMMTGSALVVDGGTTAGLPARHTTGEPSDEGPAIVGKA